MIFPDVSLKEWIKRFPALRVIKRRCEHCKTKLVAEIPFIETHWVGLQSKDCPCGKGKAICTTTPRPSSNLSGKALDWFNSFSATK